MTAEPLYPGGTGTTPIRATVGDAGRNEVWEATIPRWVLAQVSALRMTDASLIEGRSVKTGVWGDLAPHGARRIEWV